MKLIKTAIVAAALAFPSMAMAGTTYTGTLKTSDFKIQGPNKHMWKGKQGVLVRWSVTDNGGSYDYSFAAAGKNGKKLKVAAKRIVVQKNPVVGAAVPLNTVGGLTKFETGFKKKINVNFTSDSAPSATWLKLKGKGIRASTRFNYNILALIDDQIDDGPHDYPDDNDPRDNDNPTASVVPVPAAAWAGMALLGGMGAIKTFRRKRRTA